MKGVKIEAVERTKERRSSSAIPLAPNDVIPLLVDEIISG